MVIMTYLPGFGFIWDMTLKVNRVIDILNSLKIE
jgi:hypothetical protein